MKSGLVEWVVVCFLLTKKLLDNAGQVSHQQAIDKATEEYRKWQNNTLSPVEEAYLETIKALEQQTKKLK